jgi:hypothetical protein
MGCKLSWPCDEEKCFQDLQCEIGCCPPVETDVMDNADTDGIGEIALDSTQVLASISALMLRLFFRNAPSITALVVVTGCNSTIGCSDSSFKPIFSGGKAHAPRRGIIRS